MFKYRAALSKGEEIRYISHLDYASLLQRAICRAKLPTAYSEGFNPHMKISFATALPVGVTVAEEYMELELTEELPVSELKARLAAQLPEGITVHRVIECKVKMPALMSAADEGVYEISLPFACQERLAAAKAVDAFKRAGQCIYHRITPKKRREIEVKQYVKNIAVLKEGNGELRLGISISITPTGSIKPGEILEVLREQFRLPINPQAALIRRTALLSRGNSLV